MTPTQPDNINNGLDAAAGRGGLRLVSLVFLFSIFVNLLMLTGPFFMLQVYDRVLTSRSEETLFALFVLVGFLYILMAMLDFARGRIAARYGARLQSDLDARAFDLNVHIDPDARGDARIGPGDIEAMQILASAPPFMALFDVIWTPFFLGLIYLFHPVLGGVALVGGAVLVAITALNHRLTRQKNSCAGAISHAARQQAEEAGRAHEIMHTQAMGPTIRTRWMHTRHRALNLRLAASDVGGSFAAATKSLRLFLQSSVLAVGALYVLRQELSAGAMIASSIILGRALSPLDQILVHWPSFRQAFRVLRLSSLLVPGAPAAPAGAILPRPDATLRFDRVSVSPSGPSRPVLHNVSFELRPGQALGVIGRSGSGKSSLAKAALGYWQAEAGQVYLGSARLGLYPPHQLGQLVGYLPQHLTFFSGSIAENIARMAPDPDAQGAIAAAKRAGAHDMVVDLPNGYATRINAEGGGLSGGQRQRIALARALYSDPVMLVLDEPNSALDADGSATLNQTIRGFKALGSSVLVLTHRPAAIAECDHLVILERGRVISYGPRDDVLRAQIENVAEFDAQLRAS